MNLKVILFTCASSVLFVSFFGKLLETKDLVSSLVFTAQVLGLLVFIPVLMLVFMWVGIKLFGDKE